MIGINKIDHICIAVRDLQEAKQRWGRLFGKSEPDLEYIFIEESIEVARYYVGEVGYELMRSTQSGSHVDRFIEKHGEGVMLISFRVPDTAAAIPILNANDFAMIDQKPRVWEDSQYAFLQPGAMNGVLVEIIDGKHQ
ncbi:MAG: VOC family protein [Pseudomonadota bacterium]